MLADEKADNIYQYGRENIKITVNIIQELYVCQTKQTLIIIHSNNVLTSTVCLGLFT